MGHRFVVLMAIPGVVIGLIMLWASYRIATTNLLLGLLMFAFGATTAFLMVRRILGSRGPDNDLAEVGALRGPEFDYLIWTALGIPVFLVLFFIVLAVTGGLTSR
jgi:hypothetical protein